VRELADAAGVRLLRMEDGFVRSVGLGSDLIPPQSFVLDSAGLYFDPSRPSELENLLNTRAFTPRDLERARKVRAFIVRHGITKYNLECNDAVQWSSSGRQVVLVPGQVENDASIAFGAPAVRTNLGLLEAVRRTRPDAWIVYKPHPDVLAGKRPGEAGVEAATQWCDQIVTDVPIHRLFAEVDELQVLTSLAGFEALLRGREVITWGLPFYARWGLTDDRAPPDSPALRRRQRRLQLDELVAAALILYPTYVSRRSGAFTTPERALRELIEWRDTPTTRGERLQRLRRQLRLKLLGTLARLLGR